MYFLHLTFMIILFFSFIFGSLISILLLIPEL